jgi:hypothetical protein
MDQNVVRGLCTHHSANDFRHLLRCLPPAVDHFGITLPQRAMMIDFREAEIFEGELAQFFECFIE